MDLAFGKIILQYLLLPVLGIILGLVAVIMAKKNQILANKKAIFFFLFSCIFLAVPALLGFIDYWFMPYIYIALAVIYLILGYYFPKLLAIFIPDLEEKPYYVEFLSIFLVMLISTALFSLVFNLCNELQYGLWACTCVLSFILPTLLKKTYSSFIEIPLEVYKIWSYGKENNELVDEYFDTSKIIVVELELVKSPGERTPLNIKAKASENIPFGIWFKIFIEDYNKKSPQSEIESGDYEDSYGWIFYINTSILGRKKYIDPDQTFTLNKIKEKNVIIAKRVQYEEYNDGE